MGRVPAYHRVAATLRAEINEGHRKPGERLASEAQLVDRFGVSRNTVRQALDLLHSMNLITRQQGRGTFVAPQGLSDVIGELKSLTEVLRERGLSPGIQNLTIGPDHGPPIDAVDFFRTTNLWRIRRLRTGDGRPFCDMSSWVPEWIGRQLKPAPIVKSGSLYQGMRTQLDIQLKEATEIIRAEGATRAEASCLEIAAGSPVIVIYRWVTDQQGRPTEYVRAAAPGDRYQYLAKLRA